MQDNTLSQSYTTWHLIKAFWQSEHKKLAYGYLISLIFLSTFIVALNVIGTYWFKFFWDALQNYDMSLVVKLLEFFVIFAGVFVMSAVYQYYLQSMFCLRWRNWLTQNFITKWFFVH